MTELDRSRPVTLQHGDFTVEAKAHTILAPGTEMLVRPALTQEEIARFYTNGIIADTSEVEDQSGTRIFITGEYAEQAGLAVKEDGSLASVGVRGLLKILSSEDGEQEEKDGK